MRRNEIDKILSDLGFEIDEEIKIPSWRHDIESINDLAEEVARVIGYDNIPKNNLKILNTINTKNINSKRKFNKKLFNKKWF